MAGAKIALTGVAGELQDDGNGNAAVNLPLTETEAGFAKILSENDAGVRTGTPSVASPETDSDYRMRVTADALLDTETFNYTAQNTGKHGSAATTMTQSLSAAGLLTNASSITTTTTGVAFFSRAFFPMIGTASLYCEFSLSVSAATVPTNTIVDMGLMLIGAANPYAPTDGVYLRQNSTGWLLVRNHNGTEVANTLTGFSPVANQVYQVIIDISEREVRIWIDNELWIAPVSTPASQGQPFMAGALQFGLRHAITGGAAGGVYQVLLKDYTISKGGLATADRLSTISNRMYGSYQGLSGGTMGSLASYANSANPTAAVPTNTTAALGSGLGGQFWETATLAVNTDGIICSFQAPAATVNVTGRRLCVRGLYLWSYIQTAITGGPFACQYSLAFGHTAVSLATAEAAGTKAPRRIALPFDQVVTAAQAVSTKVAQTSMQADFGDAPIYVNPGEFVALVTKHVGTVGTAGVIAHMVTFVYAWE